MKRTCSLALVMILCAAALMQPANSQTKRHPARRSQNGKHTDAGSTARRIYSSAGTYLIITHHSPENCLLEIDNLRSEDSTWVAHSWFGCLSGDHTVYTLIDALNIEDALQKVPALYRENCKVLKVSKMTADLLEEMHKEYKDQKM